MRFDHFTLALMLRPPDAPQLEEARGDGRQDAHLAYLAELHVGLAARGGPIDHPKYPGSLDLDIELERARELKAQDEAVRAGSSPETSPGWFLRARSRSHPRAIPALDGGGDGLESPSGRASRVPAPSRAAVAALSAFHRPISQPLLRLNQTRIRLPRQLPRTSATSGPSPCSRRACPRLLSAPRQPQLERGRGAEAARGRRAVRSCGLRSAL